MVVVGRNKVTVLMSTQNVVASADSTVDGSVLVTKTMVCFS